MTEDPFVVIMLRRSDAAQLVGPVERSLTAVQQAAAAMNAAGIPAQPATEQFVAMQVLLHGLRNPLEVPAGGLRHG